MGSPRHGARPKLGTEEGRTATPEQLRRHVARAPVPYLRGALDNPSLTETEVVLVLRNPAASADVLTRVGGDSRWNHLYPVRRGLVRHPATPVPMARGMARHLYWQDLVQAAQDMRLHPGLRRQVEDLIKGRLEEMTVGERITLARRAGPRLIPALRALGEERVLAALLGNESMTETEAVGIASAQGVSGDVLRRLADHPTWGNQRSVRLALVRNPRTPVPVALRVVAKLPRKELGRLAMDSTVPNIVRLGAGRQLESDETDESETQHGGPPS